MSGQGVLASCALLALATLALLFALSGSQATERAFAERALTRAAAALTDADSLAVAELADLQAEAAESGQATVPDFPIEVSVPAEAAAGLTPESLSRTLTERAGAALYDRGSGALRAEDAGSDAGAFSRSGAVERSLNFLQEDNHGPLRAAMWVLAAVCGALAALVFFRAQGYERLSLIGLSIGAAALLFLLFVFFARLALALANSISADDTLSDLLSLAADGAWLPLRNALALLGLGAALVVIGMAGGRFDGGPPRGRYGIDTGLRGQR